MIKRLFQELRPERFLPSLTGGVVSGVITITYAAAFCALILTGDLAAYLPLMVIWFLLGAALQAILTAWFSSLPCSLASIQESSAVVLSMTAVTIVKMMPASASSQEKFFTIAATIGACTVLTGLIFLLLGQFRLGDLVRYLPYPVIGGFLAGSGLLLVLGGVSVMTGTNVSLAQLPALFQPALLVKWLPGTLYAVILMALLLRVHHFMLLPGSLLAGIAGFYVILWLAGVSIPGAQSQGLLLGAGSTGGSLPWQLLGWPGGAASIRYVSWPVVAAQSGSMVVVALIMLITQLLNTTGIELDNNLTLDFNRELKASGIANLVSGLLGCMPGAHTLSDTSLVYKMGGRSRMAGLAAAAVCLFAMIFGGALVSYFPTPILGGLLMLLGFDFLYNWVYRTWARLPLPDYVIILVIALVMVSVGVLQGIGLGLFLAIILFVIEFSHIHIVSHTLTGKNFQSKVSRPRVYEQLLRQKGDWIYILELQGYIFFGTANKLLKRVSQRIEQASAPKVQFVVLDFRKVSDLDSSTALSFSRLNQIAMQRQVTLVFTQLSPKIQKRLERDFFSDQGVCRVFPDLDHGVAWCEDQMIETFASVGLGARPLTLMAELKKSLPRSIAPDHLMSYFERLEVKAGTCIIRQGAPSPGLYFVETGLATVQLEYGADQRMRLRTLQPGTLVGEMGLYLGGNTSASVYADQDTTLFHLSPAALREMEDNAPEVAAAFHKLIARTLSEKLLDTTESLQAFLG